MASNLIDKNRIKLPKETLERIADILHPDTFMTDIFQDLKPEIFRQLGLFAKNRMLIEPRGTQAAIFESCWFNPNVPFPYLGDAVALGISVDEVYIYLAAFQRFFGVNPETSLLMRGKKIRKFFWFSPTNFRYEHVYGSYNYHDGSAQGDFEDLAHLARIFNGQPVDTEKEYALFRKAMNLIRTNEEKYGCSAIMSAGESDETEDFATFLFHLFYNPGVGKLTLSFNVRTTLYKKHPFWNKAGEESPIARLGFKSMRLEAFAELVNVTKPTGSSKEAAGLRWIKRRAVDVFNRRAGF